MATSSETRATEYAHIVCTPGILGGEPRIDGHRISVRHLAAARDVYGLDPEATIREFYPGLTLAEVHAALAYFEDHRDQMAQIERAEEEFIERFKRENPTLVRDHRPPELRKQKATYNA